MTQTLRLRLRLQPLTICLPISPRATLDSPQQSLRRGTRLPIMRQSQFSGLAKSAVLLFSLKCHFCRWKCTCNSTLEQIHVPCNRTDTKGKRYLDVRVYYEFRAGLDGNVSTIEYDVAVNTMFEIYEEHINNRTEDVKQTIALMNIINSTNSTASEGVRLGQSSPKLICNGVGALTDEAHQIQIPRVPCCNSACCSCTRDAKDQMLTQTPHAPKSYNANGTLRPGVGTCNTSAPNHDEFCSDFGIPAGHI